MNKLISIILALVAGVIFYGIGRGAGLWLVDIMKDSGGIVTASEMIQARSVVPVIMAVAAAWIVYNINRAKK